MEKKTVVIVDDHKLVRQLWATIFAGNENFKVVGESGEFTQAVELIKATRPHLVLLDINLSNASGMDAVPLIRKFCPGTKIIAVSMHNQPAYAKKMIRLGASGYVTKNSSQEEILKAAAEVMNGNVYICTEIKDIISAQLLQSENTEPDIMKLSLREMEVIKRIKQGQSSKEIAADLHLSTRTVEVHRHNILKKLKLKNTASLIHFISNTDLNFA